MKRTIFLFALLTYVIHTHAQCFIGMKFMGVSFHTDNNYNGRLYKTAIGKNNRVAFHFGIALTAEYKINNWFSVKVSQSGFRDCAGKFAGMTMLNLRGTLDLGEAGDISGGIGPFWYYRRSWLAIDDYADDGYFRLSENGKWQKKFVWYGGEIEYNYPINESLDRSTNVLPGVPVVIAVASGVRTKL